MILPITTSLGEHELRWLNEKTRPVVTVTIADLDGISDAGSNSPPTADRDPDRIVEIAMTSGTTGMPKLASLSAGLKQATFEAFTSRLEISEALP